MDHIVQNWPRSDLDGLVSVWPNASGLKASWCARIIRPGFWQDVITSPLPVSHFQTRVAFWHRRPGSYCTKPAQIRFSSGWICSLLAKQIRSRSKLVFKNHPARFWPTNQTWHVYWVYKLKKTHRFVQTVETLQTLQTVAGLTPVAINPQVENHNNNNKESTASKPTHELPL